MWWALTAHRRTRTPDDLPRRIGRYQILSELGRGAMGLVYLAFDPNIDRRVALKVFAPATHLSAQQKVELRLRFLTEARAAGKLKHPNVVTVHDADTDKETGKAFIAMEWMEGPSLQFLLDESDGRLSVPRTVRLLEQIARGLDAAHRHGLVHRDIKPANILLDGTGVPKISDFGIAELVEVPQSLTGLVIGSPLYMSPEQLRSERADPRSDLFAFGVVLYQCLSGRRPFEGSSLDSIRYKVLEIEPRPLRMLNPEVPDELASLVSSCLAKDPEQRPRSARDIAETLRSLDQGEVGQEVAPRRREAPPGGGLFEVLGLGVAAIVVLLGALLFTGGGFWSSDREGEPTGVEGAADPGDTDSPEADVPPAPEPGVEALTADLETRLVLPDEPPPRPGEEETTGGEATPETEAGTTAPPAREKRPPRRTPPPGPRQRSTPGTPAEPRPAPTPPAAKPHEDPARRTDGQLSFIFVNRLREARVRLLIDGKIVWSRTVKGSKNLLKRASGNELRATLDVPQGGHVIEVWVTGSDGRTLARRRLWGTFRTRERRTLQASAYPTGILRLDWLGD